MEEARKRLDEWEDHKKEKEPELHLNNSTYLNESLLADDDQILDVLFHYQLVLSILISKIY